MESLEQRFITSENLEHSLDLFHTPDELESLDDIVDNEDVEVECDICGTPMEYEYGKYVCPNCGYTKTL